MKRLLGTIKIVLASPSLGPVLSILAIFSNANILKIKRIKRYHIKGIGCPLLISINIDAWGHRQCFPLIIWKAD